MGNGSNKIGNHWSKRIYSSDVLRKLFRRLPDKLKAEFIPYSRKYLGTFVKLRELVDEAEANAKCYFDKEMHENHKVHLNKPRKFIHRQSHSRNAMSLNAMKEGDTLSKTVYCDLCRGDQKLWNCASFKEKSQKERFEFVKTYKLSLNCLQPGHRVVDCGLHRKCRECGKKYNVQYFEFKAERSMSQAGKGPVPQPIETTKNDKANIACNICDVPKNVDGKKLYKVVPVSKGMAERPLQKS